MSKARILAVDDQVYFRNLLEELLAQDGYEVQTAASGLEALETLGREPFDIVLTDVEMPDLSGTELVARIKAKIPDQEVVVVTGVGDVRIAVEAMRVGASDYLVKPVDAAFLSRSLQAILQRRQLRDEHASLMAENLEFLGTLSLYERSMALFATRQLGPLADRILEGLCLELRAASGAFWARQRLGDPTLHYCRRQGVDRDEPGAEEPLLLAALPEPLRPLVRRVATSVVLPDQDRGEVLWVGFYDQAELVGLACLVAPQPAGSFAERDRKVAEQFAAPAGIALANVLRTRGLEEQSFRDPATQAYTRAYFEDVVGSEIRKAGRFGRTFSWLAIELAAQGMSAPRGPGNDAALAWVISHAGRVLRTTDLLSCDGTGRFDVLLPETDAMGAAVLKRRVREILKRNPMDEGRPAQEPRLAVSSFPFDGTSIEALGSALSQRLEEDAHSLVRTAGLMGKPFPSLLASLPGHGTVLPKGGFDATLRFVLAEVDRRAGERSMLALAPGAALGVAREGIARLESLATRSEIVLVTDVRVDFLAGAPVTLVSPQRIGCGEPFLFYYAQGPAYAAVGESSEAAPTSFWQTSDRTFVEELAFQLTKALGMSIGRSVE